MNKKGFVISTDSFLGLTLLSLIIIFSLFYLSQLNVFAWDSVNLIDSARDVSVVLEKSGVFENSVKLGSSELLLEQLNATPQRICFEVIIFDKNSLNPLLISTKAGCLVQNFQRFSINRSFIVDSNFYLSKIEVWYK